MDNESKSTSKKNKNDEIYTRREDIENEMKHYFAEFKGKSIFCNCNDSYLFPLLAKKYSLNYFNDKNKRIEFYNNYKNKVILDEAASQFWVYFHKQFKFLGLKELVATHYKQDGSRSFYIRYDGNGDDRNIYDFDLHEFKISNGDFRSEECIKLLKKADIVVAHPPFDLTKDFVPQIIQYQKKFLIIVNINAIHHKNIFPLLKEDKIWLGKSKTGIFFKVYKSNENKQKLFSKIDNNINESLTKISALWFTNLDLNRIYEDMIMVDLYKDNEQKYPKYDNFDAININKLKEIPNDYLGIMGVPLSFLQKHNPHQFEIIGCMTSTKVDEYNKGYPYVNGEKKYARILIKRKGK
ncbi:MAG: adenine-specific methyltransferase EcoRI family protein [Mycoplasmoidaceae bacterium]